MIRIFIHSAGCSSCVYSFLDTLLQLKTQSQERPKLLYRLGRAQMKVHGSHRLKDVNILLALHDNVVLFRDMSVICKHTVGWLPVPSV